MKAGDTAILNGTISFIMLPKGGIFFDDVEFSIFELALDDGSSITCKGEVLTYIKKGMRVVVSGKYETNVVRNNFKGKTNPFSVRVLEVKRDLDSRSGIKDFISLIAGEANARNIIYTFATPEKALNVIKTDPIKLEKVPGIGQKTREKIVEKYNKVTAIEKTYNELRGYGFELQDCIKIQKIKDKNGNPLNLSKIKENPYFLIVYGFQFAKCDEIALQNGIKPNDQRRIRSGILEAFRENSIESNTFIYHNALIEKSIKILETPSYFPTRETLDDAISKMEAANNIYSDTWEGKKVWYSKKSWFERQDIKEFVQKSINSPFFSLIKDEEPIKEYERTKGFKLGKEQVEAVFNSASHRLSIITGGPGTGKTTILDCFLSIMRKFISPKDIALCAPTGKAAARMTESTGMPASTIHTLLKVDPTCGNLEKFQYNADNKLPYKLIVIDESSMIDQFIAASLLRAMKPSTQVVFVGDIEQLAPVGAGYFLRDLIIAKAPIVRLLTTYRQAGDSSVIKLSSQIRDGKLSKVCSADDFGFLTLKNQRQIIDAFLRGVKDVGVEQIVILTPQNKGDYGTKALNNAIINELIPAGPNVKEVSRFGYIYREGARIMQVRNNNELGLVNGQMGYVKKIDLEERIVIVEFDGNEYDYDYEKLEDVTLGYCVTIHKSQGSEWKYVIQICSSEHKMNTKPLVYTGITRAKKKLMIIGDFDTFLNCPNRLPRKVNSTII